MSQEKIFQFRRRFDSLYWQQFSLIAGILLLTLLLAPAIYACLKNSRRPLRTLFWLLAAAFGVESIPTLIAFKNGVPLGALVGLQTKESVIDLITG